MLNPGDTINSRYTVIKPLEKILHEQGDRAEKGYIICRVKEPMEINDRVTALPWFCL